VVPSFTLAAFAVAQPSAGSTFCGHWTLAVSNGSNTATDQLNLLTTVVSRTILGCTVAGGCVSDSLGLLQLPLNARYFNGSGYIARLPNYLTDTQALATLQDHLRKFFGFALGCTVYMASLNPPYVPPSLFATHGDLRIDQATFNEFIGDGTKGMTGALAGTGVPLGLPSDELSEFSYLAALVGALGVVPGTPTCVPASGFNDPCFLSVCSNPAACNFATGFEQLVNSGTTAWANGLDPTATTQNVAIPVGGSVNWRFGSVHNLRQVDSDGGSTYTTGGFGVTGFSASHFTYTHRFTTAGTYFFRCEAHVAMHGFVQVGSGVAGLTASLTVLAAAIVAAKALML